VGANSVDVNSLGCKTFGYLWATGKPLTHPVSQEPIDYLLNNWQHILHHRIPTETSQVTGYPLERTSSLSTPHASKHIHLTAQCGAEEIMPTWLSAQHKILNITSKRKIMRDF